MSSSSAQTLATNAVADLQDYFEVALPIVIPVIIAVAVLFAGYYAIKRLGRSRV